MTEVTTWVALATFAVLHIGTAIWFAGSLKSRVDAMAQDIHKMQVDMAKMQTDLSQFVQRLSRLEGRLNGRMRSLSEGDS